MKIHREALRPWVFMGIVGKPHGLKGAFWWRASFSPEISFEKAPTLRLAPSFGSGPVSWRDVAQLSEPRYLALMDRGEDHHISKLTEHSSGFVVHLEGFFNREQAQAVQGWGVFFLRRWLDHSQHVVYWGDLYGQEVLDVKGRPWARVVDIHNYGASDVLTLRSVGGQQWQIPYVEGVYFAQGPSLRCLKDREDLTDFSLDLKK